jgi:translation elongation factor P/translation initiation factor 5A
MIDRMQRRSAPGLCEICEKQPATRKAKFSAQYLQSTSVAFLDEEAMVGVELEKRVCEECLNFLQKAKNVTNLTFERL